MKKILMNVLIFLLGTGLVACSSNTQNENTVLGAASGAVAGGLAGSAIGAGTGNAVAIGVGAVTGAIVGGVVGHSMDHSDNTRAYRIMDYNPTNKQETWQNKKTHSSYTVKPTSNMLTINGNPNCRKFTTMGVIDGKASEEMSGTACRQPNGTWKAVS